jgi:hypothetical protein
VSDAIIEALRARARAQSTETLVECVKVIGGGMVDINTRMVRAALIDVYEERAGEAAADALMDEIGL